MRLNLHDFSGHPFQAQLSRFLAAQGHDVVHSFSAQYITGRGRLNRQPSDPATLRFVPITADVPMVKYSPGGRVRFERSYAAATQQFLRTEGPFDVVVSCNVPLLAAARIRRHLERSRQRWVLWHQDIYSMGMASELGRRLPEPLARPLARRCERLEARQVADADAVVPIGDAFLHAYRRWGVYPRAHVIPNWAPLDELRPRPRDNAWAAAQRLPTDGVRLLYAGTLGRKHNPLLLLELLDACRHRGVPAHLVVVSEGVGADAIRAAAGHRGDVRVLPYQPAECFADVLGAADVVVSLLEPEAAQYSIPSKVLSYLSAGRPIVGLMPDDNPAAGDILDAGGFVGAPGTEGVLAATAWIASVASEPGGFAARGRRARHLAETRFDIDTIGRRFEAVLTRAAGYAPRPLAVDTPEPVR